MKITGQGSVVCSIGDGELDRTLRDLQHEPHRYPDVNGISTATEKWQLAKSQSVRENLFVTYARGRTDIVRYLILKIETTEY
jgi:hypothetical protein